MLLVERIYHLDTELFPQQVEQEPGFKCLSVGELAAKMLTAPLVFPGDPEYDPE